MNPMLENIKRIPEIIEENVTVLDRNIRHSFSHHDLLNIKEIVLTGCGDSFFAPIAAKYAFQRFAGVKTVSLPAMEAGRYYLLDNRSPFVKNPLVLAISVSGEVSRTVEALLIAKEKGCSTVAVTGNLESSLAQGADYVIDGSIPVMEHRSPGIISYRMSYLILLLFAIHLAEVRGTMLMSEADALRKELVHAAKLAARTIEVCSPVAKKMAKEMIDEKYFVFVSDGPGIATAEFSAAKIIEATGNIAKAQNTEEYAHLQYFETANPATPTFLISSGRRGLGRSVEISEIMKRVGRKVIFVSNDKEQNEVQNADYYLSVAGDLREEFAPLVNPIGCELFSAFLAENQGSTYFRKNRKEYQMGNGIRESRVEKIKDLI